jgi:hypothetical protein
MYEKITKIIAGIILLIMLVGVGIVVKDWIKAQQAKRFEEEPYFTEYHISAYTLEDMQEAFYIKIIPDIGEWEPYFDYYPNLDKDKWPDYSFYEMQETEMTGKVVEAVNYILFKQKWDIDQEGIDSAEGFGLSAENPMTVEWVMKHPNEAVAIMSRLGAGSEMFTDLEYVEGVYEKSISE